ncbi:IS1182 family transposase, partial [Clostridiales bacterium COT073_COT-073]
GTKIESVSNKYRFVWRGSVEKHQAKLHAKIKESFSLPAEVSKEDIRKAVKKAWNHCREECKKQKIVFVYGSGKRKTEVQREYVKYEEWLEKLKAHEKLWKVNG